MNFGDARLPERFWLKVSPCPMSGCWIWIGAATEKGYGRYRVGKALIGTHRLAFEAAGGRIPDGLVIDHLCRTPSCCNPRHLEAVTYAENARRSDVTASVVNGRKTHCHRGHPFNASNTKFRRPNGEGERKRRGCLACERDRDRARQGRGPSILLTNPEDR